MTAARRTPLHDWHVANGGRMVEFGGFDMPVQYADGIIAEHLATRRSAGLFDVSHMGRLRLRGSGAADFLGNTLTNDATRLTPGRAHYTFLADEDGGALDDAYVYRVAEDDFLLVVNASNHAEDLAWIEARRSDAADDVNLEDESESVSMIALQGPESARMLETIVPAAALPEDARNRHATTEFEGTPLLIARTGYTGEAVCFELFVSAEKVVEMWERLVAAGAAAVGLGARDSLRMQAGLPLHGHELGLDPAGATIPIFAHPIARFGVRKPPEADDAQPEFPGRQALERQRAEFERLKRDGGAPPSDVLPRLVAPVAAFGERRPLRAGREVHHDGRPVGHLTSGASLPTGRDGAGGRPELLPAGLALIDAALALDQSAAASLEVVDERGNRTPVSIVKSLLNPAPLSDQ